MSSFITHTTSNLTNIITARLYYGFVVCFLLWLHLFVFLSFYLFAIGIICFSIIMGKKIVCVCVCVCVYIYICVYLEKSERGWGLGWWMH